MAFTDGLVERRTEAIEVGLDRLCAVLPEVGDGEDVGLALVAGTRPLPRSAPRRQRADARRNRDAVLAAAHAAVAEPVGPGLQGAHPARQGPVRSGVVRAADTLLDVRDDGGQQLAHARVDAGQALEQPGPAGVADRERCRAPWRARPPPSARAAAPS